MRVRCKTLALLCLCGTLFAQAQPDSAAEARSQIGFTMHGATGLFLARSPLLVEPGNFVAGFSVLSEAGSGGMFIQPIAIGYGVARMSETFLVFSPKLRDGSDEFHDVRIGLKALGLELGIGSFAVSAEYCSTELARNGVQVDTWTSVALQTIVGMHIDNLQVFVTGGVAHTLTATPHARRDRLLLEIGISYPILESLLGMVEVGSIGNVVPRIDYSMRAGVRLFVGGHLQINAGLSTRNHRGALQYGAFLGVGFSTARLSAQSTEEEDPHYLPELPDLDKVPGVEQP
ncbi:MAG: hypothetical protein HY962_11025 [Ignavibacteriae bacterium]|nr:hypothetical protein [Ignavibacteriota bacterium]